MGLRPTTFYLLAMHRVVLLLLFVLLAPATTARAQLPEPGDGFTWQRVGDRPIDTSGLTFKTDAAGDTVLWAGGSEGLVRLDLAAGLPGTWEVVNDFERPQRILVLGRGALGDTLVATRTSSVRRSLDGGQTFEIVYGEGWTALAEIPPGSPRAGRLLVGDQTHIAYSDDRGETWTPSTIPGGGTNESTGADDFLVLPPGSSHPGRVLAAGRWGVTISDDGGQTFRESALYGTLQWVGGALAYIEATGDIVLGGRRPGEGTARAWRSADGGETWQLFPDGTLLPESGAQSDFVEGAEGLGGLSAVMVLGRGTVSRTDNAGATWVAVGRAPDVGPNVAVDVAVVGPDGRLYVGIVSGLPGEGWVWRTEEVVGVPVSGEAGPEGEASDIGLEVRPNPSRGAAEVVLTLSEPSHVSVAVYDVVGRRVASVPVRAYAAGRHSVALGRAALGGSGLAPGVYVVRVVAGETVVARRLTVVR